ncbi:MAG: pentapeptide repeat-containing protein [Candidatus Hodarchaeota archaeon]
MHNKYKIFLILFFILTDIGFSLDKNPSIYPYKGTQAISRYKKWMWKIPLNFNKKVNFSWEKFDSTAYFEEALFDSVVYFIGTEFSKKADFQVAQFRSSVQFRHATFKGLAEFEEAQFHECVDFSYAKFNDRIRFNSAIFNSKIYLNDTYFDSTMDFSLATIKDTIFIGNKNSDKIQKYNFLRAKFLEEGWRTETDSTKAISKKVQKFPGARILIFGPVNLKIQLEKFKFLKLCDTLDYFSKKDIISILKDVNFKGNKYNNERFELDYLFERSTIFQKKSTIYEKYSIPHPVWCKQFLYDKTMGLGYRPLRLGWWSLIIILGFSALYLSFMSKSINHYIVKKYEITKLLYPNHQKKVIRAKSCAIFDSIINCFFFSSMLFFTIKLNGDLLTSFRTKDKYIIFVEWLIGLLIYIAVLILSKSGFILHYLKSFFDS